MIKKNIALAVLLLTLIVNTAIAQATRDSLHFMQSLTKADDFFTRKSYDSALVIYQEAYTWAIEKKMLHYYNASACLLFMGHCYYNQSLYTLAHKYYYTCLQNARKYNDHYRIMINAFRLLNLVHNNVQEEDVIFSYPVMNDYSVQQVFFTINKVLFQKGDSAVVEINAGTYDGVTKEKNAAAELFSIVDAANNEDGNYKGTVKVSSVTPNRTIASISLKESFYKIKPGWQIKLLVNTPAAVTQSPMNDAYRLNFIWQNGDGKQNIFNRRFLYYFSDKDMGTEIMDLFREELIAVVKKLAPDTSNANNPFRQAIPEGIFKGKNVITALHQSNVASINYFYHFMVEYYSIYFGRPFKFAEAYATWALNNSELTKADLKKYILGDESKSAEVIQRASLVIKQVEKNNATSIWVDEGLKLIDKSYWYSLISQCRLLTNYGIASKRRDCIGWSDFFSAVRLNNYGNKIRSDSFLVAAYNHFEAAGSKEGMKWIQSSKPALNDSSAVHLAVQRGHTSYYDVYASPNERHFATAGNDFTIKIWDINLGKQIHTLEAHSDEVYSLAYNPGGRYLASLSNDSTIKIWNCFSYKLMNTLITPSIQRSIKFSPDGKYLISSGFDSTVNFWEPFTGKLVRSFRSPGGYVRDFSFRPKFPNLMDLLCSDSAVYEYRLDTLLVRRTLKSDKETILTYFFSNDATYICYTKTDSTFTIWNTETGKFVYSSKIYAWKNSWGRSYSDGAFSPDSKYFLFCASDSNTFILNLNQEKTLGLKSDPVNQYVFNSNGNYFITHNLLNPEIVDFSDFDWQKKYDIIHNETDTKKWNETYYSLKAREINNESQQLLETRFTADDKSLFYLSWGNHKLDLRNGKTENLNANTHSMWGNHDYPINDEILLYRKLKIYDTLIVYQNKEKKILAMLTLPGSENITSFSFFGDDKFCFLGGAKGSIACWNIAEKKMLYHKAAVNGSGEQINSTMLQPGTTRIIAFGNKTKPLVIDLENGKLLDSINIRKVDRAAFAKDKLFFTSDSGRLFYADPVNYLVKLFPANKTVKNFLSEVRVSTNLKYLYVLDNPYCYVYETGTMHLVNKFSATGANLANLSVSHNDSMVAIGSTNGEFTLYHPFTGRMLSTIYLATTNDLILTDSAGHYLASKNALRSVVFNQGYRSFNYDEFDLKLNQPHKVLSAIGIADTSTINAYKNAYQKRLQRNGLSGEVLAKGTSPSIIILNRGSIRPTTSLDICTIRVECYDNYNKLNALKVFVNDVPVSDSSGNWLSLDTASMIFNIKVPLTTGNNKVKIYCVNKLGLSSYKEMFDIYCTVKEQKQDTYFIGLGVNLYADQANNLTYSVKDIRDLAKCFKNIYPAIIIDTLINEKVTLKNIELLKQRLKKIKVTDRVIMAVTGHGLLSDSLDFYYATYDVDFKNPVLKGLKYEELENILVNTAARQRLLLIDACHSGMMDKETLLKLKDEMVDKEGDKAVKVKGARGVILKASKLNQESSFDLMQNLFADLSNDNGIVVISAAGGLEYAFESKLWHNGIFTYCVRKGIDERAADNENEGGNDDGKVTVQELMRYVGKKVPELTRGMQRPTSRRENIDSDWQIR
jgi:WD40 repeat protein